MSDEAVNDRAVEKHDRAREAANQVCPTCHGSGAMECPDRCGGFVDRPDCDGEGVAW